MDTHLLQLLLPRHCAQAFLSLFFKVYTLQEVDEDEQQEEVSTKVENRIKEEELGLWGWTGK